MLKQHIKPDKHFVIRFLYILTHEKRKVYGFKLIHKKARIINNGYSEGYSEECIMKTVESDFH